MQTHRLIAVLIGATALFSTLAQAEPPNLPDVQAAAIAQAQRFPPTDNPEVARLYATAFLVQEYLKNRKLPYENDLSNSITAFVNLVRSTKEALK